jgi:hypothetical protein
MYWIAVKGISFLFFSELFELLCFLAFFVGGDGSGRVYLFLLFLFIHCQDRYMVFLSKPFLPVIHLHFHFRSFLFKRRHPVLKEKFTFRKSFFKIKQLRLPAINNLQKLDRFRFSSLRRSPFCTISSFSVTSTF